MKVQSLKSFNERGFTTIILALAGLVLTGCSEELASYDDVYVPVSVEETHPIRVIERPVNLTIEVGRRGVQPTDMNDINGFARSAAARSSSRVTVSYPAASKNARRAAEQTTQILMRNGVSRSAIHIASYDGKSDVVTLSFNETLATTRPCGDWSENLRAKQSNDDLGPNFGCAFQQNIAAMVTDPEDFVRAKQMPPARSAPQNAAIQAYESGNWTTPNTTTNISASD